MATEFVLGLDAALYWAASADEAPELSTMTLLDNIKDLKMPLSKSMADTTTRANSGWRSKTGTLKECTITFNMQWIPGDEAFEAIRDSFLAGGDVTIHFACLDQAREVTGAQGMKGDFAVSAFDINQELENTQTVDVTLELNEFTQWVEVVGS